MNEKILDLRDPDPNPIDAREIGTWALFLFGVFLLLFGCPLIGAVLGGL
ncbi:MAG: hypothetical protein KAJ19_25270 [Gammaproteobacteria bacterium]|nr:hypothetical protein [Gammaproteobacteria bacterium]